MTAKVIRNFVGVLVLVAAIEVGFLSYHEKYSWRLRWKTHPKLLLVTFDGVRYDYVDRSPDLPAFKYLIENGVRAKYQKGSFPTQSSPSHFTIATGLYSESHGIVNNCAMNRSESYNHGGCRSNHSVSVNSWWDNGVDPIWVTAVKQDLRSGAYLFPGSGLTMGGRDATLSVRKVTRETKESDSYRHIDHVIKWLKHDDLDMVAMTFGDPDSHVHELYGPDTGKIEEIVLPMLSRIMMYLFNKVEEAGLTDDLNIIITSDHGHSRVNPEKSVNLIHVDKIVNFTRDIKFSLTNGPISLLEPKPNSRCSVYMTLKDSNPNIQVYLKEEFPERWHFKHNPRIPSILVLAKPGYQLIDRYTKYRGYADYISQHGYDNDVPDMWSFYFSIGPSFKKNYMIKGFESVHIYPLMCHLLGLNPAPNNGSLDVLLETVA